MKKVWTMALMVLALVGVMTVSASATDDLQTAINTAGTTPTTITLTDNVEQDITIAENQTITIALADYKITNSSGHTITNNGTLTITGTGTVDNVSHGKAAVYNNGTAYLNGGTYERSVETGSSSSVSGDNSWYTIANYGNMEMSDVTVKNSGKYSSAIFNDNDEGETMTIKSGTYTGGVNVVKVEDATATLVIEGGEFSGAEIYTLRSYGTMTISGGTFSGNSGAFGDSVTNVSGGLFDYLASLGTVNYNGTTTFGYLYIAAGNLNIAYGETLTIAESATLYNKGTITLDNAAVVSNVGFSIDGNTITASAIAYDTTPAALIIAGTATNTGTIDASQGSVSNTGTITNDGEVILTSAADSTAVAALSMSGTGYVAAGTAVDAATYDNSGNPVVTTAADLVTAIGSTQSGSIITINGDIELTAGLTVPSGVTLVIPDGSSLTFTTAYSLTNNGTVTVAVGGVLVDTNGTLAGTGETVISGTYKSGALTGGTTLYTYYGPDSSAIFQLASGASITLTSGVDTAHVEANGNVTVNGDALLIDPNLNIEMTQKTGTLTIPSTASLALTSGSNAKLTIASGATLAVAGTLEIRNNGVLSNDGTITNTGTIAFVSNTMIGTNIAAYDIDNTYTGFVTVTTTAIDPATGVTTSYNNDGTALWYDAYTDGTKTYTISTATQLTGFATMVNAGTDFDGYIIQMTANIDLASAEWTPIGSSSAAFKGTFDGGSKTISNLSITGSADYVGLFGYINGATIKNVTVSGSVSGATNVGGIVGYAKGAFTISGCTNNANVSGTEKVAGILGGTATADFDADTSYITNCSNTGSITISSGTEQAAGIAGYAREVTFTNCMNSGTITSDCQYTAGIVAYSNGCTISNCSNSGTITGTSKVGGIVGQATGSDTEIKDNSTNTGAITSTSDTVGSIIGYQNGATLTSYTDNATVTWNVEADTPVSADISHIDTINVAAGVTLTLNSGTVLDASVSITGTDSTSTLVLSVANLYGTLSATTYSWDTTTSAWVTVPDAPVITASAGNGQVTINWTAPYDGGSALTSYYYYVWAEGSLFSEASVADPAATSVTVTGLTNGTEYSFYLHAENSSGANIGNSTGWSDASVGVTATPYASSSGSSSYSSSVSSTSNGDVSISSSKSTSGTKITITTDPDNGYVVGDVSVTYSSGREVSVTDNGDGTYSYLQPGAAVTVTVTFISEDEVDEEVEDEEVVDASGFSDVDPDAYYYDAMLWAVENGITSGYADGTFGPTVSANRAQVVTFLWRAAGEPVATIDNPFTDLDEDAYYYEAVLWAVENGITAGTTDTTFGTTSTATRGQIVTFLYRLAGEPDVDGEAMSDVVDGAYYYNAVLWAVENGITTGYSDGTFGPTTLCNRGQIVTFLYRYMG